MILADFLRKGEEFFQILLTLFDDEVEYFLCLLDLEVVLPLLFADFFEFIESLHFFPHGSVVGVFGKYFQDHLFLHIFAQLVFSCLYFFHPILFQNQLSVKVLFLFQKTSLINDLLVGFLKIGQENIVVELIDEGVVIIF